MNVLKAPTFFRPSTPTSAAPTPPATPRPESNHSVERGTRPLTKLSLGGFMRQPSLPTVASNPAPVVQDASYLETLGLKLSEAVTKALVLPAGVPTATDLVSGKKPLPAGRGLALGNVISSELKAVQDNSHLHRAALRSLQKPLSVLLTNLSGLLLPLLASQSFLMVPTFSNQFSFPNPIQSHALSVSKFCEELLEVFDEMALGSDVYNRNEGLRSIRDGLISLMKRIINPLIGSIRAELIPLVEALESPNTSPPVKAVPGSKSTIIYHQSITALQILMPPYAKVLMTCTTSSISHAVLASLLISVLWKALVALSHRVDLRPPSPLLPDSSLKKVRGSTPAATPPVTPPPSRFSIKLPPSRPASPPLVVACATPAQDCKALYDLLAELPRPVDGQAQEAVHEAFEGLRTLPDLLATVKTGFQVSSEDLDRLTADIPFLVALPLVLSVRVGAPSLITLLGISEDDYRKGCLSGFSRAEECAEMIGRRVLEVIKNNPAANQAVIQWLETEMEVMEDE